MRRTPKIRLSMLIVMSTALVACESATQRFARLVASARSMKDEPGPGALNEAGRARSVCEYTLHNDPACTAELARLSDELREASQRQRRRSDEDWHRRETSREERELASAIESVTSSNAHRSWQFSYRDCVRPLGGQSENSSTRSRELRATLNALCAQPVAEMARMCHERVQPLLTAGRLSEARAAARGEGCSRRDNDAVAVAALALAARSVGDATQACEAVRVLGEIDGYELSTDLGLRFERERAPVERACVGPRLVPVTRQLRATRPMTAWLMQRLGAPVEADANTERTGTGVWNAETGPVYPAPSDAPDQYTVLRCERRERQVTERQQGPALTQTGTVTNPVYTTRGNITTMRMETTTVTTSIPTGPSYVTVVEHVSHVQYWDGHGPAMRFTVTGERCTVGSHDRHADRVDDATASLLEEARRRAANRTLSTAERLEAAIAVRHLHRFSTDFDDLMMQAFALPVNATIYPWHTAAVRRP